MHASTLARAGPGDATVTCQAAGTACEHFLTEVGRQDERSRGSDVHAGHPRPWVISLVVTNGVRGQKRELVVLSEGIRGRACSVINDYIYAPKITRASGTYTDLHTLVGTHPHPHFCRVCAHRCAFMHGHLLECHMRVNILVLLGWWLARVRGHACVWGVLC